MSKLQIRYDTVKEYLIKILGVDEKSYNLSMRNLIEIFSVKCLTSGDISLIVEAIPVVRWYINHHDEIDELELSELKKIINDTQKGKQ